MTLTPGGLGWMILDAFNVLVLGYFFSLNFVYLVTSIFAFWALRRYALRLKSVDLGDLISTVDVPPITLIAPAYNEEPTCVEATRSLLTLEYPEYEVIVVNDASTDHTLAVLRERFDLYRVPPAFADALETAPAKGFNRSRTDAELLVVDKEAGDPSGKAGALNVALNACRYPYCVTVDADTVVEPTALRGLGRVFFLSEKRVIGSGGSIRRTSTCSRRSTQSSRSNSSLA